MKHTASAMSREEVSRIAAMARLTLTEEEVSLFSRQLGESVETVRRLQEIDTQAIPFPPQITGLVNVFRPDTVEPSLAQEVALGQAAHVWNGYFVVEAIFQNNEY